MALYFLKEDHLLMRAPARYYAPDRMLTWGGWYPYDPRRAGPVDFWTMLTELTEAEARQWAAERGIATAFDRETG